MSAAANAMVCRTGMNMVRTKNNALWLKKLKAFHNLLTSISQRSGSDSTSACL